MRSLNSLKNTIVSVVSSAINIIISFVATKFFLSTLGEEYLGLNGLFSNILSILAIAELGFGSAITYSMYEPLANDNKEKIKSLLKFYKIVYYIITLVVLLIGLCFIPFLDVIVGESSIDLNITFLYLLFLFDLIASYTLTYKRSILYANQQTYIINAVHIGYLILMNIAQILVLVYTSDYVLYLIIKIVFRLLENIVLNIIANKLYPYINDKNIANLPKEDKEQILQKVKGLLLHKIGDAGITGSDNIIISSIFGIGKVGLYTNYITLTTGLNSVVTHIFSAITASVGNLLLEKNSEKSYNVYKTLLLFNYWIYTFATIGLVCLAEPLITIWIGSEYLLDFEFLVVLSLNFFISGMKHTCATFKNAAGVFYEDRYVPILEVLLNIVFSIIFAKYMGLSGVVVGTAISSLALFLYSYPIFVFKPLFGKSFSEYIKELLKYLALFLIIFVGMISLMKLINFSNFYVTTLIKLLIVLLVPNLVNFLIFYKTDEFKYYVSLIQNILKNKRHQNK